MRPLCSSWKLAGVLCGKRLSQGTLDVGLFRGFPRKVSKLLRSDFSRSGGRVNRRNKNNNLANSRASASETKHEMTLSWEPLNMKSSPLLGSVKMIKHKGPSLPEFMNFKLFGKTVLAVNIKLGLFGPSTQQVRSTSNLLVFRMLAWFQGC